jgi:N-acetyl-anhydromuramoyl-L-alanine amidase
MRLDRDTWLTPARHCPSPNHDARPPGTVIDLVVIHCISLPPCQFGHTYIDDLFCNRLDATLFPDLVGVRVSAHILIRRDGEVVQYVPFARRAWHAGISEFEGRTHCNDFSIGIELEGCIEQAYCAIQYQRLNTILRLLMHHWPGISRTRITAHSIIAPQRKQDPGPLFAWAQVLG